MPNSAEAKIAKKSPTIYDVATLAGVSKSLVSLVLSGDSGVSEPKRKAVVEAIKKLEYRPSKFAQQLAGGRTKTIGVIITDYRNLSFIGFLRGIREVADDAGFQVIVSDLHNSPNFSDHAVSALTSMSVDGIVIAAEVPENQQLEILVPFVTIGERYYVHPESDLVCGDDSEGMRLVVSHLVELGHKEIIHITGYGGLSANRKDAFIKFMEQNGLKATILGHGAPTTEIGGYLVAKEILDSGLEFTAISAANDAQAAGVLAALKERGIRVPEDVSVVGYDNTPISSEYFLKLTTVDEVGIQIGREAARILLDRMDKVSSKARMKTLISPQLSVRSTTAKVASKRAKK
jgi:DNA-binding LacI/PurR family transcriptional regulator